MHVRPASRPRRLASAVLAFGLASTLAGCVDDDPAGSGGRAGATSGVPADGVQAGRGSALEALDELEVKGRAPRTGYDRDLFGSGWVDTDRNGCDTRNDVLARDLTGETFRPGTRNCVVLTGTLADPYSGRTISFQRGQDTSDDVQVDHVVALSDAWQKGAQQWDGATRTAFANDPLNLLAVDGPLNMQKGDGDAATWLPPDTGYRCAYVARQVAVKVAYGLWATPAERDAMSGVLARCPDEPLPAATAVADQPETAPSDGASYADCGAVRAAGAAPIHVGDPGWRPSFDGDGDGIGCEG
ncbi:DUF1524 domain-containing protein [Blastococcus montanus]|uniref:GmrSD restriction endonuclease domain-containing protein n=1 Tax=Blastococcus montanus TaxID=3144973 RepID=UPI0032093BC6